MPRKQLKEDQIKQEIERLKLEKEFLVADKEKLQNSMPYEKAAEEIIKFITSKTDPFNSPDNLWVKPEGGACCIIM